MIHFIAPFACKKVHDALRGVPFNTMHLTALSPVFFLGRRIPILKQGKDTMIFSNNSPKSPQITTVIRYDFSGRYLTLFGMILLSNNVSLWTLFDMI